MLTMRQNLIQGSIVFEIDIDIKYLNEIIEFSTGCWIWGTFRDLPYDGRVLVVEFQKEKEILNCIS